MKESSDWLGASSRSVAESLIEFTKSSELLSSDPQLVERYPQKWIGVCSGEVKAAADDLESLLRALNGQSIVRSETVVRFIEKEQRTLIL